MVQRADAARDRGRYKVAALLYHACIEVLPRRQDLLVQAGNCHKDAGEYRRALEVYGSVADERQWPESSLQLGHLLKITGNLAAALICYDWAAARGMSDAGEMAYALRNRKTEPLIQLLPADRIALLPAADVRLIEALLEIELRPLSCISLAAAAEWLDRSKMPDLASIAGDLAMIIGGPAAARRNWAKRVSKSFGKVNDLERASSLDMRPAFSSDRDAWAMLLADDLGELADSDGIEAGKPNPAIPGAWPGKAFQETRQSDWHALGRRAGELRAAIFAEAWSDSMLRTRILDFVQECLSTQPVPAISLAMDFEDNDWVMMAERCLGNACRIVAERLGALEARMAGNRTLPLLFHIPTHSASIAIGASGDRVAGDFMQQPVSNEASVDRMDDILLRNAARGSLPEEREDAALRRVGARGASRVIGAWLNDSAIYELSVSDLMHLSARIKRAGSPLLALELARKAANIAPGDKGISFEIGLLCKTCGHFAEASQRFVAALESDWNAEAAGAELAQVVREVHAREQILIFSRRFPTFKRALENVSSFDLLAGFTTTYLQSQQSLDSGTSIDYGNERLEIIRIGHLKESVGNIELPRLVGIVSIRALVVHTAAPQGARIRIDGRTLDYVEPSEAHVDRNGRKCFYFNSWIDVSGLAKEICDLTVTVDFADSSYWSCSETVIVSELQPGEHYPESDSLVIAPVGKEGLDAPELVASLANSVRNADRTGLGRTVNRVLLMRLDQLGDVATSMAAANRLKAAIPNASFYALVTPANAYIAKSVGLFDEVITVDFPYDHSTRRRHLSNASENFLTRRFAEMDIDMAIDLSPGYDSRPVLKFVGARYMAGFKPREFDFLDFGIDLITRDRVNRRENISHTAMVTALVEAILVAISPPPPRFPMRERNEHLLSGYNLVEKDYIAIHSGARLTIKRWPLEYYVELAELILKKIDAKIVFFSDEVLPPKVAEILARDERIVIAEGKIDAPLFDELISNAAVFVGNDTGPKHLAAVRGVYTISVHMGQVNWNEWGQDGRGLIVSRRMPCVGCGIEDPMECGKALACLTQIKPADLAQLVVGAYTEIRGDTDPESVDSEFDDATL